VVSDHFPTEVGVEAIVEGVCVPRERQIVREREFSLGASSRSVRSSAPFTPDSVQQREGLLSRHAFDGMQGQSRPVDCSPVTSAPVGSRQDETVGHVKPEIGQYLGDALFNAAGPCRASGSTEIVEPAQFILMPLPAALGG
jgi:hypothetical protein